MFLNKDIVKGADIVLSLTEQRATRGILHDFNETEIVIDFEGYKQSFFTRQVIGIQSWEARQALMAMADEKEKVKQERVVLMDGVIMQHASKDLKCRENKRAALELEKYKKYMDKVREKLAPLYPDGVPETVARYVAYTESLNDA